MSTQAHACGAVRSSCGTSCTDSRTHTASVNRCGISPQHSSIESPYIHGRAPIHYGVQLGSEWRGPASLPGMDLRGGPYRGCWFLLALTMSGWVSVSSFVPYRMLSVASTPSMRLWSWLPTSYCRTVVHRQAVHVHVDAVQQLQGREHPTNNGAEELSVLVLPRGPQVAAEPAAEKTNDKLNLQQQPSVLTLYDPNRPRLQMPAASCSQGSACSSTASLPSEGVG